MTVVFFGTSRYAVTVLRRLAASQFRPALVVTPPDRRRGRGRRTAAAPAASEAAELGLDLLQTESVNRPDAVERVRAVDPDLGLVCAFGQLIGSPLLDELEMLNVHPSLLPRWRGAAPIERAIIAGDSETGVTIMRVTAGLDSGPIALQEPVPIAPDDDYGTLSARLAELGGELGVRALAADRTGELDLREQDDALATYAEKITAADRLLDVGHPADDLERRVRALHPHVGTYLELASGERLGVRRATAVGEGPAQREVQVDDGALLVGCADGALRLEVVQPPGGRAMRVDDYLRGHPPPRL